MALNPTPSPSSKLFNDMPYGWFRGNNIGSAEHFPWVSLCFIQAAPAALLPAPIMLETRQP
jgi:hypothetical protein